MSSGSQRKVRRPRSVVWYYFDKLMDDPFKAKCKLCNNIVQHGTNTSNLFYHLRHRHPATYEQAEDQREQEHKLYQELKARAGKTVTPFFRNAPHPGAGKGRGRGRPPKNISPVAASENFAVVKTELDTGEYGDSVYSHERRGLSGPGRGRGVSDVCDAIVHWLTTDMLHPSIITKKGFKNFLSACRVKAEAPTKQAVTDTLVPKQLEVTKISVKSELQKAEAVALTLESWNHRVTQAFITITAHFISERWTRKSYVLDTFQWTEDKTESNLSDHLKRVTEEWELTDKVAVILTNEPDEVVSSSVAARGWEEFSCFGRALNLIIGGAITSVSELTRVHNKLSAAVNYFCRSSRAAEALSAVQLQHGLPSEKLFPEQAGVWGTSLTSIAGLLKQYEAVNTVLCFLGQEEMCLCDDDVELLQGALQVLKPFEAALEELSSEPYTCVSKIIPIAGLLQQVTSDQQEGITGSLEDLRVALLGHLEQLHLNDLEKRPVLATASLLDPRFKEHAFTDSVSTQSARDHLLRLTQDIVKVSDSTNNSATSTVNNSSSSTSATSLWSSFDQKLASAKALSSTDSEAENELHRFFQEVNISRSDDPLKWWRINEVQFPHLRVLAQRFFCVPATAVPSARIFTKEGAEFVQCRDQFRPTQLNSWLFLSQNLL